MTRPRYHPGSTVVINVKNRSGIKPLSAYLASRLGVVESWTEGLIADGCVAVDGESAVAGQRINLSAGPHTLEVRFPENWPRHMAGTPMALDILYEDTGLVVVNKPAGMVVHPARGHMDNQTLQNGLRYRFRHLLAGEDTCIAPAHRLDRDTSGALVFALTRPVYRDLVAQFAAGQPHKEYLAILDGDPPCATMVCDQPVGPDPDHPGRGCIRPDGKRARTDFTILEKGTGWALARAIPHTGRPHQIRIHAAGLGLPLAGDADYNPHPGRLGLARQGLHAHALCFTHPVDGQRRRFQAPLASDLLSGLTRLRSEHAASPVAENTA
ncbi:MAG: RluA family pseudouridine synthase [Planctomycetes bacterium]|nr:RluA family pseudouridine synthase [Planctomycetota bacterium]